MNYPKYQEFVMSRAKPGGDILDEMNDGKAHILHMAVGLMTEVVEIIDHTDETNFQEELGDLEFYLAGLLFAVGEDGDMLDKPPMHSESHALSSLLTSSGSVLDRAKKLAIYNKAFDPASFRGDLFNVREALDSLCFFHQTTPNAIRKQNYSKLMQRYPTKYSNKDAIERKDKK